MKGLSKLCPLICSLAIILVTMVTAIGVFPLPSVAETQSEVITDIATYTDTDINEYNNVNWGMPQGMRSRITVGGKAYLKYENEQAYGKARLPVFAEKNQNWSGYSYVEFPVINNSEESDAPLLPFFVVSNDPFFNLKNDSPLKIMGTQSGQTEELVRDRGYIIIPKGFNGIVRMPVSSDTTQYEILEGEGSWSLSNITQMGFYFNNWVSVDVSIGNITLVKDVPTPPTSTESSAVSTTTTTEETTTQSTQTSATTGATTAAPSETTGFITDIASYTMEDITLYNQQTWGLPQGSRTRQIVDGKAYLKYVNAAVYGKARLPQFEQVHRNWSNVAYIEFAVINNNTSKDAPIAPLFFVSDDTYYLLAQTSPLQVTGIQGERSSTLSRDKGYIVIPAGFNGIVRVPISAAASNYTAVEGTAAWSVTNIEQMGFYFNDWGTVDVSIGDIKRVIPDSSGSTAATSTVETTPSLKSGPITNIADMTEAQIKEYTGVAWGLPKGDRSRVQVDGKAYLRYVNAAGAYGKARLPMLSEDKRDWSKVTYIEIPVINNSNSKGAPILPFFHVDDNTYYCVSQGAGVLITGNQNGETIAIEMDKDYMVIPAGFKGTIRIPMSAIESHYTAIEGTTPWSLKNIQQIGFFFNDWGQVDISIGDISVFVSGGDGESVNTGYGLNMLPVFIALIAASVVLVFVKRYRKICG